jgi:D-3-phosphoglycerate dehydrogenase
MKVLVTCPPMLRSIDKFRDRFAQDGFELVLPNVVQTLTEEELIEIVPNVDGWIIGDDPATEKVFLAGKSGNLKAAVKWGVGVDNVDFKACEKLGIPITNTPNMFGSEVAALAINYLLGLARESYFIDREIRKGNWVKPTGYSLEGKKVGVIGFGDIGKSVSKMLKVFGVDVIVYDPFAAKSEGDLVSYQFFDFPQNIEEVDFIIITCALNDSTRRMINQQVIEKLKEGISIINVSRGGIIDEGALIGALNSGKIRSAALDVFEVEPLMVDSPFIKMDNVILGSHNASNTHEAVYRASDRAIDLLFSFLKNT